MPVKFASTSDVYTYKQQQAMTPAQEKAWRKRVKDDAKWVMELGRLIKRLQREVRPEAVPLTIARAVNAALSDPDTIKHTAKCIKDVLAFDVYDDEIAYELNVGIKPR